jgi:hypothetical protein
MIKYYNIYPPGVDPHNLHDIQKILLIYLAGIVPKQEDWSLNVAYFKEKDDIKNIKSIELEDAEIDIANLHGQNIEELHKLKLIKHKENLLLKLNEKYGIKEKKKFRKKKEELQPVKGVLQKKIAELISFIPGKNKDA